MIIFALGIPSSLSLGVMSDVTIFGKSFFDLMDFISSNLLLPIGGLFISLFVGWVIWGKAKEEIAAHDGIVPMWINAWGLIVKFVAPVAIAFILLKGLGIF